jgi:hypothetical protein
MPPVLPPILESLANVRQVRNLLFPLTVLQDMLVTERMCALTSTNVLTVPLSVILMPLATMSPEATLVYVTSIMKELAKFAKVCFWSFQHLTS